MTFADQDEPSRPRRRRGSKRGAEEGFDDFWTRESQAVRGRGRKHEDDPADVSDLTGPTRRVAEPDAPTAQRGRRGRGAGTAQGPPEPPVVDVPTRTGRRSAAGGWSGSPAGGPSRRPPLGNEPGRSWSAAPAPGRGRTAPPGNDPGPGWGASSAGGYRGRQSAPGADWAGPEAGRNGAPDAGRGRRGRRGAPPEGDWAAGAGAAAPPRGRGRPGIEPGATWSGPPPGPSGAGAPPPARRGRPSARPGEGYAAYGGTGPVPPVRSSQAAADWYDDAASGTWDQPPTGAGTGPGPDGGGGYAAPPWAAAPPAAGNPRRARLESTSSYRLASTLADDNYGDDVYFDDDDDDLGGDDLGLPDDLPKRRGCRVALAFLAVLVLAVAAVGFVGWRWVQHQIDPPGGQGKEVLVDVPAGTSTAGIGKLMADHDVITNASVWSWYTKLKDVGSFQAGSYRLHRNSSFDEAVADLDKEPLPPHTRLVTVPEGYTLRQTLARLGDKNKGVPGFTQQLLLTALKAPTSRSKYLPAKATTLEGTLFPDSYAVGDDDNEAQVVQRMVAQFDKTMDGLNAKGRAAQLKITPYQAVIVASLVEEEARVPEDRPKVARVIYNRLAKGMPLGIDAALCYEKGQIPCKLTESDLDKDSPYNTRHRTGLTPTPVASPGKASLAAALQPASGNWLYYVLIDAQGHHAFTNDYDEFTRLKAQCAAKGLGCG